MSKSGSFAKTVFETPLGGSARLYINKTGAPSVKGMMVNTEASVDGGVNIVGADEPDLIGAIYNSGIPDGGKVWVVTNGPTEVLLEDNTIATRGYWCRSSITQAGRVDATNAAPPGGTINAIDAHFKECGHCEKSALAGIDILTIIDLHFN